MRFVKFPGYGVNGSEKVLDLSRAYMWTAVDYNGVRGTEVYMVGADKPILVGVSEWDFTEVMKREMSELAAPPEQ